MSARLVAGVIVSFVLLLASPLVPVVVWSVAVTWPWPELFPRALSARSWELAFDPDAGFLPGLGWSFGIGAIVTALALVSSLPLGRLLGLCAFRGKSFVEILVLAPLLLPVFVSAMGLHETFLRWGLADSATGVILIHLVATMPYMVRALSSGFASIGTRLEDQARTLGAGPLRVALRVTLPRLVPAMATGSVFVFLASLGDYLLTQLVGGDAIPTLPLALFPYIASGDRSLAAVGSLLLVACPLATFSLLELALAALRPPAAAAGGRP